MDFYNIDNEFESQYADDLDVLRELEEENHVELSFSKSKENLNFRNQNVEESFRGGNRSGNQCEQLNPDIKGRKRSNDIFNDDTPREKCELSGFANKRARFSEISETTYRNKVYDFTDLHHCSSVEKFFSRISVTGMDGSRIFLPLRKEEDIIFPKETWSASSCNLKLLGKSYWKLREEIENERERKLLDKTENTTTEVNQQNDHQPIRLEEAEEKTEELSTGLWVDKYRPRYFMELLSDDGINRTLLHWLKLWDIVVFGQDNRRCLKGKENKKTGQQEKGKFFKRGIPDLNEELDEHKRPQYKIALLTGPPGLGKTTLAQVIAKHAGYNVVELNASDDRSPEVFTAQLEAATQMRAVMGQNCKPNCLVIDEIDGAPQASINILVSLAKSAGPRMRGKRKKGEISLLLRPIICICNDQYVAALRPLRQIALVMNFPSLVPARLATRLHEITCKQWMKADMTALLALCEQAENDIRSCLSTLQFIGKRKREFSLSDVQKTTVGQKDFHRSLFSVWQDVFQIPRLKRKQVTVKNLENAHQLMDETSQPDNTSFSARFSKILHASQSCGDYEKLFQGLFENYLLVNFKDPRLQKLVQGSEWLCFTDIVQHEINHAQIYTLFPYLPFTAVAFHLLFAVLSYTKLSYPSADYEFRCKQTTLSNMLKSMFTNVPAQVRCFVNPTSIVEDLLPNLFVIIQPKIRPVNTQLYSDKEREEVKQVLRIMISYNLSYRQERSSEGQYEYKLEPNLEELVKFSGIKLRSNLTYAAKQLLARELDMERVRQGEEGTSIRTSSTTSLPEEENKKEQISEVQPQAEKNPNHMQTITSKTVKIKPVLDFFGNAIKKPSPSVSKDDLQYGHVGDVWFHFKEGYSNAVRKTVRVQDLL